MSFATADLNYFVIKIGYFNWKALPQKVSMAKLAQLPTSPGIDFAFQAEGNGMTLSALNVYDVDVL